MTALYVFDTDGTLLAGTRASVRLAATLDATDVLAVETRFAAGDSDTRGFAAELHDLFADLELGRSQQRSTPRRSSRRSPRCSPTSTCEASAHS